MRQFFLIACALGVSGCASSQALSPAPQAAQPVTSIAQARPSAKKCANSPCLYFADGWNYNVLVYPLDGNGNIAPVATIGGSNTGLYDPQSVAFDQSGNIYVSDGYYGDAVSVFAAGANGNVSPTATIGGSYTELDGTAQMAFDSKGELYIGNCFNNTITVFAKGASGNVAPVRTLAGSNTGLSCPDGVYLDKNDMYVANQSGNSVTVYKANASGNAAPLRTIAGSYTGLNYPYQITVSAKGATKGTVYVANVKGASVLGFAAGANGNAAPSVTIAGSNTGITHPVGVALDSKGNIYVSNGYYSEYGELAIFVFAAGSNGNVAPIRTITGSSTEIASPVCLTIH